jgi:predicted phosphodiesterase
MSPAVVKPVAPQSSPMAFMSDIHGNLRALEAVLAELDREGVHTIFALGDHLLGGDEPLEVWRRLNELGVLMTRGISDTALAQVTPRGVPVENDRERALLARFESTRKSIGDLVTEQLRRLPEQRRVPLVDGRELMMVHGSPRDSTVEMTHDLDDDEMLALIDDDPADVVVCGAAHVPFRRDVADLVIVNVGSVGQAPEGNVAHYTVITPRLDGTEVRQSYAEY